MAGLTLSRSYHPKQCRLLLSYVCVLALPVFVLSFAPSHQWHGPRRSCDIDPSRALGEPRRSLDGARVEALRKPCVSGRRNRGGRRLTPTSSLSAAAAAGPVVASVSSAVLSGGGIGAGLNAAAVSALAAAPVLGSLGVLTMVIALHEAGHLVAALSQGIRVNAFSIGFGPKLLSYRKGSGGGDGVGGGKVKGRFSGPSWDWGTGEDRRTAEEMERKGAGKGKGKLATAVDEGGAEEGVEYTLRAIPVGGFVSFPNNYEMDKDGTVTEYDDPNLLSNRGPASRAVVIVAGVVVNFLLAWACIFGSLSTTGIVEPHFAPGVVINEISDPKGGAAAAGFHTKDVFLSINGNALAGDSSSLDQAVGMIRSSGGKSVTVELARDGAKPVTRTVKTAMGPSGKYTIGVRLAPNLESVGRRKAGNPVAAAGMAYTETVGLAEKTLDSLVHLVSTGETEGVSGPVEIVKIGAEVATDDGATALLQFAAVISVNLAVINSLPVPGLDGGQMVFVLAELLSRKKLDRGVTETINGVALLVLLTISLSTFAGDLGIGGLFQRIFSGAVK